MTGHPLHAPSHGELTVAQLRRRCDPAALPFDTTAEVAPVPGLIGQHRAEEALRFGLALAEPGFNLYVAGPEGTGKTSAVRGVLEGLAGQRPTPPDWYYVHNFRDPSCPQAIALPPGLGRSLRHAMRALVQAARREIPRAFESEEYIARREVIVDALNKRREQGLSQLALRAQQVGFLLQPTPMGISLTPVMGGRQLTEEDLAALPPEMRGVIDRNRDQLDGEIHAFLKDMRAAERETREQLEAQDREVMVHAVGGLVDDLAEAYTGHAAVLEYLEEVREGLFADVALFRGHPLPTGAALPEPEASGGMEHAMHERAFRKYEVNVLVEHREGGGAPVVIETHPTYPNLIGRVEREALFGALVTDFTLIGPGSLHRANGGYLVLRADELLRAPLAWEALKRALRERSVAIEDPGELLGMTSTRGLRADPIPLDVKALLIGEPALYDLLYALDPDFRELFKVRADFDTQMERTAETEAACAAFFSACCVGNQRHADRGAVARLLEESSRLAADQRKLSTRLGEMANLLREADYWAGQDGATLIEARHVRHAVEQRQARAGLVRERLQEQVARGVLLVRPSGQAVGQAHGLAVLSGGGLAFGHPSRITTTVGAGRDGVVDIEHQVQLGGPIHSKGVLILAGYLHERYARDKPLALTARLVFEQSYTGIEGDSASLAELLALLSGLGEVPLNQAIAITGSVNQRGEAQAVGGVNEKIEGFFDTCLAAGLSGEQGVILPVSNVEHLMLRDDVVEAVAAGRFHVYAVGTVDEALEILTGLPAGQRGAEGAFPVESVHGKVDARLRALAEALREFAAPHGSPNGRGAI